MADVAEPRVASPAARWPELWLFIGLVGLNTFTSWPINMGPFQTGALMEGMRLSSTQAGLVSSAETIVFAIVLMAFPRLLCRIGTRTLGLLGLAGALLGNLLASQSDGLLLVSAARALAGASIACVALAGFAALATAPRVDRMSAAVTVVVTLTGVAAVVVAGRVTQAGSYGALFLFTAALAAGSAVVSAGLPERRHVAGPPLKLIRVARSPLTLAAVTLSFGGSAVWAFAERIGVGAGLEVSRVAEVLAGTLVFGLLAGVVALVVARPGRQFQLFLLSVTAFGAGCFTLALAATPIVYIVALVAMTFFFVFQGPFFVALAAAEDPTGGLVAAITGWATLVSAAAPAVAGALVEGGTFWKLAWLCLATTVAGAGALVYRLRKNDRPTWAAVSAEEA